MEGPPPPSLTSLKVNKNKNFDKQREQARVL